MDRSRADRRGSLRVGDSALQLNSSLGAPMGAISHSLSGKSAPCQRRRTISKRRLSPRPTSLAHEPVAVDHWRTLGATEVGPQRSRVRPLRLQASQILAFTYRVSRSILCRMLDGGVS